MVGLIKNQTCFNLVQNYQKQTYRNRCYIYGPNGKQMLTIPVLHSKNKKKIRDNEIQISWSENWQKQHWKSIESAYRSSPFFEFYEDELYAVFFKREEKLIEYNLSLIQCICNFLDFPFEIKSEFEFFELSPNELLLIDAKSDNQRNTIYCQVFDNKHGFHPNLSILDLIFNMGPQSLTYLQSQSNPILSK